uniref:AAA-ATPase ASD, mitochondrial-like n=1 Tax=Erigeron canadensis TaxID=72917 RepID=UPI001CB9B36E|nr:AAA-ATPase ASD, mitochondrial-like [Erigeron canadensis]
MNNNLAMGNMLGQLGSVVASVMFIWAIIQQYFPYNIRNFIEKYSQRFLTLFYPYIQITFNEFTGERFKRSEAYSAIETYLSKTSSSQAKRLKADVIKNNTQPLSLSMDDHEEVSDDYKGIKVYWSSGKNIMKTQQFSFYPNTDEKRYYRLTFHKRYREIIVGDYLNHVLKEGKEIKIRNRLRKLYTNNGSQWSHVVFEHPASFQTLAMDPVKKKQIIDDLSTFTNAEEFYNRIGRAWKRGYLLYGPPGTGKSTMIAAMANFLSYDIYDLELTAVKDNTELRRLLIETSSKSIIVIEDIDCSMDVTGQRKKENKEDGDNEEKSNNSIEKKPGEGNESKTSKVTLSGLLNFVDGLWSACGGDRIIVFTTNHVEKLDPALIRRGRMDKHIELSYCEYEAFKVLANNYLYLETHELFDKVRKLLDEVEITPADVAENLMPKTSPPDAEGCLMSLIEALEKTKEEERVKKLKIEEEESKNKDSTAVKTDEVQAVKVVENGS